MHQAIYIMRDTRDLHSDVVGFPCNQFGNQEPGTDEEIQTNVCQLYKTTFPIMKKIEVNGSNVRIYSCM